MHRLNWSKTGRPPISDIEIGVPFTPVGELYEPQSGYAEVIEVPVSFYLDEFDSSSGFAGGQTAWGYRVARVTAESPWQISSAGIF